MSEPTPKFKIGDLVTWPMRGILNSEKYPAPRMWEVASVDVRGNTRAEQFVYGLRALGNPTETEHIFEWGLEEVEPVVAAIIKARNERAKV